jgi:hypothetical protein
VRVPDTATAEAVKITENIFRSVNIALVNELKLIYDAMGIDVWEVIRGAATKPFGYMPFWPGPGLGGHCIPIDPFYLTWRAREFEVPTRFIELAGEINTAMPRHVVDRLREVLDRAAGRGLNGARILLVGVAYKKNVSDMRESPSMRLMQLLEEAGAQVEFLDPHVPEIPPMREYGQFLSRRAPPCRGAERTGIRRRADFDGSRRYRLRGAAGARLSGGGHAQRHRQSRSATGWRDQGLRARRLPGLSVARAAGPERASGVLMGEAAVAAGRRGGAQRPLRLVLGRGGSCPGPARGRLGFRHVVEIRRCLRFRLEPPHQCPCRQPDDGGRVRIRQQIDEIGRYHQHHAGRRKPQGMTPSRKRQSDDRKTEQSEPRNIPGPAELDPMVMTHSPSEMVMSCPVSS